MKNTQSKIKAIEIGKESKTTYCFEFKDYTNNFRPEKVKMTNKNSEKNLILLLFDLINQDF